MKAYRHKFTPYSLSRGFETLVGVAFHCSWRGLYGVMVSPRWQPGGGNEDQS